MKKILCSALVILAACSPNNKTETAVASSASAGTTPQAEGGGSMVKMAGTVHFSFEQAEFVAQGKHYFILKGQDLIGKVQEKRQSGAYNVTLDNVCIQGKVLTKEQNKGNGFGPLERYEQAVEVEGLC